MLDFRVQHYLFHLTNASTFKKNPQLYYFRRKLRNGTIKFWMAKKQKLVEMLRNMTG